MSDSKLLDIEQAAAMLAVRPGYVRRLVRERRIAFVKIGKFVRFRRGELRDFIDSCGVPAINSGGEVRR